MKINISDKILESVEKPSRYTGNEWNSVHKELDDISIRFAFCFPDVYEIGMSHLGMRILYHALNERVDTFCERVFAPWIDMESKMRENDIALFTLESHSVLSSFDFIGFTLQYEMSYTNIINMLDLSQIPVLKSDRTKDHPFVCAGGPCACNPEPLADFVDFFMLGEGEEIINEVMDFYVKWKNSGQDKKKFLEMISKIEGIYVPEFYNVEYKSDGTIKSIVPKEDKYPEKIRKRIVKDLDKVFFPDKIIVPYTDIVHDRIVLELFRGCIRGCRFCQAGYIYRPVRERTSEKLLNLAQKLQKNTGYEEISLVSLSTSDYSQLKNLTEGLINDMEPKKVNLSLPSLRVDSFSIELMEKAQKVRKSGLTFAPEAGSQRLRDVINKGVTEEDLLKASATAFEGGWSGVKLYFMIGLPTETMEDLDGIAELSKKVVDVYMKTPKDKRGKGLNINVSTSSFVPKPFTPFQWEAQDSIDMIKEKQQHLKDKLKSRHIKYNWHDPNLSFLEAVLARGDRRLGKVLYLAFKNGCKFDSWGDHFKFDSWMEVFNQCKIDPHFYANRKRELTEVFPWDHIDVGVTKSFLKKENQKAYLGEVTSNCSENCTGCGAAAFDGGICNE
ncbi:TIGR03960 family B12-binding radical SAM protein [Herbivorax sp. ANBcel31]|uniref:TIGR03960 family B12-binding radical SAM protein n=1 Tax=Herbivorax sp. ANBcel31 TaxID=3069754 RepID=UPI0027B4327F|nr:TIGR03960 family B12-binding radical SAM protein [Herbivorax sp. ANBcel31]MDQ2087295.1 TIGR03960 family B12-binding radical SAM protein [Herbivorax sp. ANBcel31]